MSERYVYNVMVDCGGITELVFASCDRQTATAYANIIMETIHHARENKLFFIQLDNEQDGMFIFREAHVSAVRVVPDGGGEDHDDDDDDEDDFLDAEPDNPTPMTQKEFEDSLKK